MITFREFVKTDSAREPHFMVIGHPIGHSLSPIMHQLALDHHGIEARYHAVDLDPSELNSFVSWVNQNEFLGANITIPYKKEFLEVVDRLDPVAEEIGAVNTLVRSNGELHGYNTDVDGFRQPLEPFANDLEGERAILFGSGGASLAVIYALRQLNMSEIVMVSRTPERLAKADFPDEVRLSGYENWQARAEDTVLLVNATPLGMAPHADRSPVTRQDLSLLENRICYELIYNPLQTLFLRMAAEAGAETIDGLEMFIGQGDRAFQLWTGRRFPRKEVKRRLQDELGS